MDTLVLYTDFTYRYYHESENLYGEWFLSHCPAGPLFVYKAAGSTVWETDWKSNDDNEVKIANSIQQAFLDIEVEKMLKD